MLPMLALVLATLVLLLLAGYPMKVPLLGATMVLLVGWFPEVDPQVVVQQMIGGVRPAALVAVPMFILAAEIMTRGQASDRLLDAILGFVGHLRGGLPITAAIGCTLFGALSGSTQATVVAIGGPIRPKMLEAGYPDSFAIALVVNASDIALLIPPSIGMIVYGVVSGTSIGEMFVAGIGPGLLILAVFSIYCYWYARKENIPTVPRGEPGSRRRAVRRAILPLLPPSPLWKAQNPPRPAGRIRSYRQRRPPPAPCRWPPCRSRPTRHPTTTTHPR